MGRFAVTFERPELLALAPLAAVVFALALAGQWRRLRRLERAFGLSTVHRLLPVRLDRFPGGRLACLVAAGLAIGVAATGPSRLEPEPPEPPPPLDVAIALDLSASMSARDASPSRVERAREVVTTLTEELPTARFALVVFAGWPYPLLPPTDDGSVVRYFASSLGVDLVVERDQGSSLSGTLALAQRALDARPRPGARQAILVLSDGQVHEDEGAVVRAASDVAAGGTRIWVAGLGTAAGATLSRGGEPLLDGAGSPVTATLNADLLRSVAAAGGGRYQDVNDDSGLAALGEGLRDLGGAPDGAANEPLDASSLLLLLAIPLLLWESALDAGRGRSTLQTSVRERA